MISKCTTGCPMVTPFRARSPAPLGADTPVMTGALPETHRWPTAQQAETAETGPRPWHGLRSDPAGRAGRQAAHSLLPRLGASAYLAGSGAAGRRHDVGQQRVAGRRSGLGR